MPAAVLAALPARLRRLRSFGGRTSCGSLGAAAAATATPARARDTGTDLRFEPRSSAVDLALEISAVERLNKGIAVCVAKGDNGTRALLEGILKGEEHSIDWLEAQLHLVKEIGKEKYLSEQIG